MPPASQELPVPDDALIGPTSSRDVSVDTDREHRDPDVLEVMSNAVVDPEPMGEGPSEFNDIIPQPPMTEHEASGNIVRVIDGGLDSI